MKKIMLLITLISSVGIVNASQAPQIGMRTPISAPSPSEFRSSIVNIKGEMHPGFAGGWFGQYDVELTNTGKIKIISEGNRPSGEYRIGKNVIPLTVEQIYAYEGIINLMHSPAPRKSGGPKPTGIRTSEQVKAAEEQAKQELETKKH